MVECVYNLERNNPVMLQVYWEPIAKEVNIMFYLAKIKQPHIRRRKKKCVAAWGTLIMYVLLILPRAKKVPTNCFVIRITSLAAFQ
jgi:hypothetical protein